MSALRKLGYETVRQSGSHVRPERPGRVPSTVPVHHGKDLAKGISRGTVSRSGFSVEGFRDKL